MTKVYVTQRLLPGALDALLADGVDVDARDADTPAETGELTRAVADADAVVCLLTDRIDEEVLTANPDLKVVANVAAGYDNIDVDAATRAGVAVTNTPGVLTETTADLALALILATARRVPEGDAFLRSGRFTHWKLVQEQLGTDVFGRTLGVFGMGGIGRAVARRARFGFSMQVQYHSRTRLDPDTEVALGVRWVAFDELLATSDVLSLHAPLTAETRHVIGADQLRAMPASAILINTARGALVDEAALAAALRDGEIAGAGLDVYEHEPQVHPDLVELRERVVLLPHVGSATTGTRQRMTDLAVGSVRDVLAGRRPANLLNPQVLRARTR